ncbi:MAG: hypothetical protein WDO19_15115 [Bacteroidota bacterium]
MERRNFIKGVGLATLGNMAAFKYANAAPANIDQARAFLLYLIFLRQKATSLNLLMYWEKSTISLPTWGSCWQ